MRLFVAVDPTADAVAHLGAELQRRGLRAGPTANWHITLAFCGEVDASTAECLGPAILAVAASHPPVELRLAGSGAFGHALWVGVEGELADLAADVARAARDCGISVDDRPYQPHLTVWRTKDRGLAKLWVREMSRYVGDSWRAEQVRLVRSHLGRGPTRHETVGSWPLGR